MVFEYLVVAGINVCHHEVVGLQMHGYYYDLSGVAMGGRSGL